MELAVIQNKIYEIRGRKVMLDFDLAEAYGIETRVLKQAVRRNLKRFEGDDFMFIVTTEELSRSHFVTLNTGRGGNFKYLPFAFTDLGIAMLSSVLNSEIAIDVNRCILRAFVAVREYLLARASESVEIAQLRERVVMLEQATEASSEHIGNLYAAIDKLSKSPPQLDKDRILIGYKRSDQKE